jgi:hypothetical protein
MAVAERIAILLAIGKSRQVCFLPLCFARLLMVWFLAMEEKR